VERSKVFQERRKCFVPLTSLITPPPLLHDQLSQPTIKHHRREGGPRVAGFEHCMGILYTRK
jgi:hypothetical protein